MLTRRDFNLALGAFSLAGMGGAFAQSQAQPIRIMVGHAAGGGVDFVARLLSEPIKTTLNQNVVVENRTGASAMLATSAVAKAAPDGKTLLMGSGEMGINPQLHKGRMPYEPQEIVPIALVGVVPCVVAVNSASTIRAPQDVVKEAKANPGKLTFSSSGVGNPQQLAGELMNTMAGIQVIHVPYRGAAPAVADVAGGNITMTFTSLGAVLPMMDAGKMRAVAVTSKERMPQLPEVPPLQEGAPSLAGYELLNFFALFGPAGLPQGQVNELNTIVNKAVEEPKTRETLLKQGIVPRPMNPEQFKAFVAAESKKFGDIITTASIKVEN